MQIYKQFSPSADEDLLTDWIYMAGYEKNFDPSCF